MRGINIRKLKKENFFRKLFSKEVHVLLVSLLLVHSILILFCFLNDDLFRNLDDKKHESSVEDEIIVQNDNEENDTIAENNIVEGNSETEDEEDKETELDKVGYLAASFALLILAIPIIILIQYYKGNSLIIVFTTALLNIGFVFQLFAKVRRYNADIEEYEYIKGSVYLGKFLIVALIAIVGVVLFRYFSYLLTSDFAIVILIFVHFMINVLMVICGTRIEGSQGATLALGNIQVFELTKLTYIWIMVGLLCKPEATKKKIIGLNREVMGVVVSLITAICMGICSEYGTLLIILITGVILYLVYGNNRVFYYLSLAIGSIAAVIITALVYNLLPDIKLSKRLNGFLNAERFAISDGMQYLEMKRGLAIGGWFGPETKRYAMYMTNESNDLMFSKLVQNCGCILGLLVILMFGLMIAQGLKIAMKAKDSYYQGLALGVTLVIGVQTLFHIGCNVGLLPLSGIPLFFLSSGYTNQFAALIMIGVLLVITMGEERSIYDEKYVESLKDMFEGAVWKKGRRKRRKDIF